MRILYQMPSLATIYAGRTVFKGYQHAFEDLGYQFLPLTSDDNQETVFNEYKPDILITGLSAYSLKYLDINLVKKARRQGLKVFVYVPYWKSPINRINEALSLSDSPKYINLIKSGDFGDAYFSVSEQEDPAMAGFEPGTGYKYHTIPLAADKMVLKEVFDKKFEAKISFIGTYLPQKKTFFKKNVFPLTKKYNLKVYGQDWTRVERVLGWVQRGAQYFNLPYLKSIIEPKLELEDEAKIYKSSLVSINVHEDYQRKFGAHCNERTFKIPLCGGFEITDDVACIRKYFKEGEEIIIAKDETEWFEKIDYYIKNPQKRLPIIEAGKKRVLKFNTYHNRVKQIINIYNSLK